MTDDKQTKTPPKRTSALPIYEQDANKTGSYCPPPPNYTRNDRSWTERCPSQVSLASNGSAKSKAELYKLQRSESGISIS